MFKPGVSAASVGKALAARPQKCYDKKEAGQWHFQPLSGIHFNTDFDGYGAWKTLRTLSQIGVFLILTACVNFVNLATAQALTRSKEIGVRKIPGASVRSIIWLSGKALTWLLLLALLIAAPVAWWLMKNWLESFAYRINIGAVVFVLAIFITILITALTVGHCSLKAALANPVKSLRPN